MIIKSLTLRGAIGIKDGLGIENLYVDFTQFAPGIIAITGPNGAGKTTFIENLTPFRMVKSRPGSLARQFFLKDSCRDLAVSMNGDEYRFMMNINGESAKLESYAYRNGECLNPDGKEATYNERVTKLFGDPDLFFSSLFMPQKRLPFSKLEPGKRKDLLLEMIGAGMLQAKCDFANQAAKRLKEEITKIEGAIAQAGTPEKGIVEVETLIITSKPCITQTEELSLAQQATIAEQTAELELWQQKATAQAVTIRELEQHQKQRMLLDAQYATEKDTCDKKIRQTKIFIEQDETTLVRLKADHTPEKLAEIEEKIARAAEIKQAYLESIKNEAEYKDYQVERQKLLAEESTAKAKHQATIDGIRKTEESLKRDLTLWETKYERDSDMFTEAIRRKERAAAILETVPCQSVDLERVAETCRSCQFLIDAAKAESEIADLKVKRQEFEAKATAESRQLQTKLEDATSSLKAIPVWEDTAAAVDIQQRIAGIEATIKAFGYDPAKAAEIKRKYQISEMENPEQARRDYDQAAARIESVEQKIAINTARLEELKLEAAATADAIQHQINAVSVEIIRLEQAIDPQVEKNLGDCRSRLEHARHEMDNLTMSLPHQKATLEKLIASKEELQSQIERLKALKSDLAQLQSTLADWEHLSLSLSRNGGFQSMLVESAGAEMTPFANELLANYGVPWTIEIATQKPSADQKKMVEGFFVIINTPSGPRELGDLSGGQEVWIDEVLYDAIANMLRRRSGLHLSTAIKDEADGALDGDRAMAYLKAIEASHRASGLHHTIIISHRQEIQDMISQKLRFVPGQGVIQEVG